MELATVPIEKLALAFFLSLGLTSFLGHNLVLMSQAVIVLSIRVPVVMVRL